MLSILSHMIFYDMCGTHTHTHTNPPLIVEFLLAVFLIARHASVLAVKVGIYLFFSVSFHFSPEIPTPSPFLVEYNDMKCIMYNPLPHTPTSECINLE